MLRIKVPISPEGYDELKNEFIEPKYQILQLEHSLVSISKWESKWCRAFLSKKDMTAEEILDYIKCMTITQNVDPDVYNYITMDNVNEVKRYIEAPMTATTVSEDRSGKKKNNEVITAELIYYWMIALQIPFECQKWHLNRLLTLIRVCNVKNSPSKKRSMRDIMRGNAELNAARRKQLNSRG